MKKKKTKVTPVLVEVKIVRYLIAICVVLFLLLEELKALYKWVLFRSWYLISITCSLSLLIYFLWNMKNDTICAIQPSTAEFTTILNYEIPLMQRKNINFIGSAITLFKTDPRVSGVLFCTTDLETIIAYAIDKGSKLETYLSNFTGEKLIYIPEKKMVITCVWKKD